MAGNESPALLSTARQVHGRGSFLTAARRETRKVAGEAPGFRRFGERRRADCFRRAARHLVPRGGSCPDGALSQGVIDRVYGTNAVARWQPANTIVIPALRGDPLPPDQVLHARQWAPEQVRGDDLVCFDAVGPSARPQDKRDSQCCLIGPTPLRGSTRAASAGIGGNARNGRRRQVPGRGVLAARSEEPS